ncbi:MAG: AGE family epimerase/isomerase [Candidatus Symbiothrix sp.]|nr:AGE family epimerase/isomerase [Candidatus Symbiothrix sp.]
MKNCIALGLILLLIFSCAPKPTAEEIAASQMKQEIVDDLKNNVLAFWAKYAPDSDAGFYGQILADATPVPEANKGAILNARILWTFSSAYRELNDEQYKVLADRAANYFLDHFLDKEYGGVFYDLHADGTPAAMQKVVYANAFAIYGLSEHYRATKNQASLDAAIDIFNTLATHAYDSINGGFIEQFSREWVMPENLYSPKSMNNNLHVLEALTNLYRVWKDPVLEKIFRKQIDVESYKVLDQNTWHENLYLTMDWQNLRHIDSYGHDIEFSWLLVEAAEVLGDEAVLADTKRIAVNIAEVQLKEGTDSLGYIKGEKNHDPAPQGFGAFPPPRQNVKLSKEDQARINRMQEMMAAARAAVEQHGERLEWWPQAEAVIGYYNAYQISGDVKFLHASIAAWNWINQYYVDREVGEWYGNVHADGTPVKTSEKASMWRCPYHNSRMGFEMMNRIKTVKIK